MKRMLRILAVLVAASFVPTLVAAQAQQDPSLGDLARHQRQHKTKPAARVYTNDDLGRGPGLATASTADQAAANEAEKKDADIAAADSQDGEQSSRGEKAGKSPAEAFKKRVEQQRKTVAALEHEVELIQREMNLDTAIYYSDAGNRLRDDKAWTEKRIKAQDDLDKKKTELAAAKQKLDDVIEEARKAGVSQGQLE